ncbi:MAG: adenine-specific methyltransferase EcoRI family protein [Acidobacteria bacterium]|nr:adenine-specific methyltransferase EcoRI family protein [Acidobacteriota bacterium]
MPNTNLTNAAREKNDEFYTQYYDIEKEISAYVEYNADVFRGKTILLPCDDPEWSNFTKYFAQNFETFGLKKLISTSYAFDSKGYEDNYQPTLFENRDPQFDERKTKVKGKIFTLDHDTTGDGKINVDDLEWHYLEGDGDFRSDEIKGLRDEADVIITNPPFSKFREFLAWIVEANKQFSIIGNMNAIKYKIVFPLIQENKMWLGPTITSGDREFQVPGSYPITAVGWRIDENGRKFLRIKGVRWFTNLDHGRRHESMGLMTMVENKKFNKKLLKADSAYEKFENYDAIEVPFTDAIPKDYKGLMGVPISFLDKYSPDQFEIIWQASGNTRASTPKKILERMGYSPHTDDRGGCAILNGRRTYDRIFIRRK